ncbi:RING finger protein 32-like [Branchiostoma lanceolatum]|uniref:RING finger protein 32-like n=1 Tax=Branchiostoma lanceolatum TaxID=7740 RepID=UPI003454281A
MSTRLFDINMNQYRNVSASSTKPNLGGKAKSSPASSTTLAAVAFQDHIMRNLSLADPLRTRRPLPVKGHHQRPKHVRPVVDTRRKRLSSDTKTKKEEIEEKEYVLDPKPQPLSLAQKLGLVEAPKQPLTEEEWQSVKHRASHRDDHTQPCVICKEDFGTQEQVLLSCSHVFHKACLQAFERFSGKKTCPLCRKDQYQTRVIHEGARHHRVKCATRIQACWRGYVVRCWYRKLRQTVPPKDPRLRQKFYEEKFQSITDRIVQSCAYNIDDFLSEIDRSVQASRDVFRFFDENSWKPLSEEEWERIQLRAVERGDTDCPICIMPLTSEGHSSNDGPTTSQGQTPSSEPRKRTTSHGVKGQGSKCSNQGSKGDVQKSKVKRSGAKGDVQESKVNRSGGEGDVQRRPTVLLSCSHVFHRTCLEAFEEFAVGEGKFVCPVCRSSYQKRVT